MWFVGQQIAALVLWPCSGHQVTSEWEGRAVGIWGRGCCFYSGLGNGITGQAQVAIAGLQGPGRSMNLMSRPPPRGMLPLLQVHAWHLAFHVCTKWDGSSLTRAAAGMCSPCAVSTVLYRPLYTLCMHLGSPTAHLAGQSAMLAQNWM